MVDVLLYEEYKEDIIRILKKFTKAINGQLENASMEDLHRLTKKSKTLFSYLEQFFEPNKYMHIVLDHLSIFGAASIKQMAILIKKKHDENIHNQLRYQALYLEQLGIVSVEMLQYTFPSPTKIYITSFCTEEQKQDSIDKYIPYKLRYEQSLKPKEIINRHERSKVPVEEKERKTIHKIWVNEDGTRDPSKDYVVDAVTGEVIE